MNISDAVLLGFIQGVTEFLPVSSSGHLVIAQSLMKNFNQPGILYDILLHFATLLSILVYFRKRIGKIIIAFLGLFMRKYRVAYYENKRFLWGIIIASIPTAIIGLFLDKYAEVLFSKIVYVGYALIITSIILYLSDKSKGHLEIDGAKAFIIGIVQGLAVVPGISRSGSTIATALFLGVKRAEAAEFSFLMSIPAIFGATLLQLRDVNIVSLNNLNAYLFGMATAFISGLIALSMVINFVKRANLKIFAIYCLIVGIVAVVWL
ncbi:undecaprenyl-diphosphate phosphatase [Deferribacter autotrophicus]|uniref:Undecaprenyl-diphosphatase n=1 Tax=Deferribacter autotrophicus TaxID=500465 RepID=A0A5A8F0E0_9BACT|nr:undecaprenyl-diphosphate phosphatase [Deferribacter autotrophicus]KAA0257123.1 undecaprenyl-diphosphate phosphatase [Deferribacter autotrophicus]